MKKKQMVRLTVVAMTVLTMALSGCNLEKQTPENVSADTNQTAEGTGVIAPKDGKTYKIGFSVGTLTHSSVKAMEAMASKRAEELGWNYVLTDGGGNIDKQIADMEDLNTQNCDMVYVHALDEEAIAPAISRLVESGTPVISIAGSFPGADVLTTCLAPEAENGYAVGEWLAEKLEYAPLKAVIISGTPGLAVCEERRESIIRGYTETVLANNAAASIEIVAQAYTDWYPEESVKVMEDILSRGVEFNAVISEADVMGMECYKVLSDAGKIDGVYVVQSADGQKEAMEMIMDGAPNYVTALCDVAGHLSNAVDRTVEYFNGRTSFPEISYTPGGVISSETVADYYDPESLF